MKYWAGGQKYRNIELQNVESEEKLNKPDILYAETESKTDKH